LALLEGAALLHPRRISEEGEVERVRVEEKGNGKAIDRQIYVFES
jgi:hypothetical protein